MQSEKASCYARKTLPKSTFCVIFHIFQLKEWSLTTPSSKTKQNYLHVSDYRDRCGETHSPLPTCTQSIYTPQPQHTQIQIPTSHVRVVNTLYQLFLMARLFNYLINKNN